MHIARRALRVLREEGPASFLRAAAMKLRRDTPEVIRTRALIPFYNRLFDLRYGAGIDVMAEDWDTLVLLDACRFDDFRRENTIDGTLESRISRGVDSPSFMAGNFAGRDLHDCVYVTGNPHIRKFGDDIFHAVSYEPLESYSPEDGCVHPDAVTEAAIDAHERFPDKRVIAHYMQPHDPPIGPTADRLEAEIGLGGWAWSGVDAEGTRLMTAVRAGDVPESVGRRAYRENLRIVLEDVESLLDAVDGKVVVSADHGEMFGEEPYPLLGPQYEHWKNPRSLVQCEVPWLIVDGDGDRRRVTADPPVESDPIDDEELSEQLAALGYRE